MDFPQAPGPGLGPAHHFPYGVGDRGEAGLNEGVLAGEMTPDKEYGGNTMNSQELHAKRRLLPPSCTTVARVAMRGLTLLLPDRG